MNCPVMGKRNRGKQPRRWRDGVKTRLKEWDVRR